MPGINAFNLSVFGIVGQLETVLAQKKSYSKAGTLPKNELFDSFLFFLLTSR